MKIRALIVEDEPLIINELKEILLSDYTDIEVIGAATTLLDAIKQVKERKPDLIFLDIMLGKDKSLPLLEETKGMNYKVIFTTSYNSYYKEAFQNSALYYIEKPFLKSDLEQAIENYRNTLNYIHVKQIDALLNNMNRGNQTSPMVALKDADGMNFVALKDILYCSSVNKTVVFYLKSGNKITIKGALTHYEDLLQANDFYRVHNKHIVNLKEITKLKNDEDMLVLTDNQTVNISKHKMAEFKDFLRSKNILLT